MQKYKKNLKLHYFGYKNYLYVTFYIISDVIYIFTTFTRKTHYVRFTREFLEQ